MQILVNEVLVILLHFWVLQLALHMIYTCSCNQTQLG